MAIGASEAIAGGGALLNYFAGQSAQNAQKEQLRRQTQLLKKQSKLFDTAQGYYGPALAQLAGRANLQVAPGVVQTGVGQYRDASLGGNIGDNTDQLRLRQGEEEIEKYFRQLQNQARFRQGTPGMYASGTQARLLSDQGQQFGQFRRGLALQAGQEQERRLGLLQNALGAGFGMGGQAAQGFGQQGAMYGQQAQQAFGDIGNIIAQYQYMQALQQQRPPVATGGTADTYTYPGVGGVSTGVAKPVTRWPWENSPGFNASRNSYDG